MKSVLVRTALLFVLAWVSAIMFLFPVKEQQQELISFHRWWWQERGTLSINHLDSTSIENLPLKPGAKRSLQFRRRRNWHFKSIDELYTLPGMGVDSIWIHQGTFDFSAPKSSRTNTWPNPAWKKSAKTRSQLTQNKPIAPVDLNSADSTALVEVRGIGPYTARKLIQYRQKYGGIKDITHMKHNLHLQDRWLPIWDSILVLDSIVPVRNSLATSTFQELLSFPELNYTQVKRIVFHREAFDEVRWSDLASMDEFIEIDTNFLKLYISD